ncbi:hypothetical protein Tco_0449659 [Tanacetum coccineum]
MVARKPTPKEGEKKKTVYNVEQPKQSKPAKQPKPVKEKASKPSPTKKIRKGKVAKISKEISSFKLVDEEEEDFQPAPKPHVDDDEYSLQRVIQMSLEAS